MKHPILTAILGVLLITLPACTKPKTAEAPVQPAPASGSAAAQTDVAVGTPATPAPAAPPVLATPPPDPIAPAGTFYLIAKASVVTDDGIIGLTPGSKVQLKEPGSYVTSAGHTVQLRDDQVTNNLRIAGLAAQSDAAAQAALRAGLAKSEQEAAARTVALADAQAKATPAPAITAAAPAASQRPPAPVQTVRSGGLGAVKSDKDNGYTDSAGYRHWTDVRGRERIEPPRR